MVPTKPNSSPMTEKVEREVVGDLNGSGLLAICVKRFQKISKGFLGRRKNRGLGGPPGGFLGAWGPSGGLFAVLL